MSNHPWRSAANGGTRFDLDYVAPEDRLFDGNGTVGGTVEPSGLGLPYEYIPLPPSIDDAAEDIEKRPIDYCDRAPGDFVVSGPLADNTGPGRRFATRGLAAEWAREFYGTRFKREIKGPNRWAFLVAAPKGD